MGILTFGGGTLQFTSSNTTDYLAQLKNSTAAPISIDTNGQSVNFGSLIDSSNTAGLAQNWHRMPTLGGNNNYLGGTMVVSGGTLVAASNSAGSSGPVVLSPSAWFATLAFTSPTAVDRLAGRQRGRLLQRRAGQRHGRDGHRADGRRPRHVDHLRRHQRPAFCRLHGRRQPDEDRHRHPPLTGVNTYSGGTSVSNGVLQRPRRRRHCRVTTRQANERRRRGCPRGAAGRLHDRLEQQPRSPPCWAGLKWSNSTAAFNIDTSNGSAMYSGNLPLPPSLGFAKLGANALILTGSNTYSGEEYGGLGRHALDR